MTGAGSIRPQEDGRHERGTAPRPSPRAWKCWSRTSKPSCGVRQPTTPAWIIDQGKAAGDRSHRARTGRCGNVPFPLRPLSARPLGHGGCRLPGGPATPQPQSGTGPRYRSAAGRFRTRSVRWGVSSAVFSMPTRDADHGPALDRRGGLRPAGPPGWASWRLGVPRLAQSWSRHALSLRFDFDGVHLGSLSAGSRRPPG